MAQEANNSGIRNAEVRYKRRINDLSTSGHVRRRSKARREGSDEIKDFEEESPIPNPDRGRAAQLTDTRLQLEAERAFQAQNLDYSPEEIKEITKADAPKKPRFPFFILILALIKDLLDLLTLTAVGYVVSLVVSLIIAAIILVWAFSRGSGPLKKRQMKRSLTRFIIANFADLIPLVNVLPWETIFVLMTHNSDKQDIENVENALHKIQGIRRLLRR